MSSFIFVLATLICHHLIHILPISLGVVRRFVEIIAGFALALDISTLASVVSDNFASAHE